MQNGYLTVNVIDSSNNKPIQNVVVNIYGMDENQNATNEIYTNLLTDESGQVTRLTLDAPNLEYSLQPLSEVRPYSEYVVEAIVDGYETVVIRGTQILPVVEAIQGISMTPNTSRRKGKKRHASIRD